MKLIVTGGAGFIGSELIRQLISETNHDITNIDKLSYSGFEENFAEVKSSSRFHFENLDICDGSRVRELILETKPDGILHLAAESHVDRSIDGPEDFIDTNIIGTFRLLEVWREFCQSTSVGPKFLHVSTDEVYGTLGAKGLFTEDTPYQPNSPYSASKAASDMLVRAWGQTYGLSVLVTNCSNNYGPYQFPEKLIPLTIRNALSGRPIRIYGDGLQIRDWLHVSDHVRGIRTVFERGEFGCTYNIGAHTEKTNLQVVQAIITSLVNNHNQDRQQLEGLLEYVEDRPGHDLRYAIDASRISSELGWTAEIPFQQGIEQTVAWYVAHDEWCELVSGNYDGQRLGGIS